MTDQWYYTQQGQRQGPVSVEQLKQLASSARLKPSDLVWKEGMAEWGPASSVEGMFASSLDDEPPPIPPDDEPPAIPKETSAIPPTPSARKSSSMLPLILAALIVALVGIGAYVYTHHGDTEVAKSDVDKEKAAQSQVDETAKSPSPLQERREADSSKPEYPPPKPSLVISDTAEKAQPEPAKPIAEPLSPPTTTTEPQSPTRRAEVVLFNGQNLEGWTLVFLKNSKSRTNTQWSADSVLGELVSSGGDWIDLQTDRMFKNFKLNLEWRFTPGGFVSKNGSGIVVRSRGLTNGLTNAALNGLDPQGIEINLREGKNEENGMGTGCFTAFQASIQNHRGSTDGGVTIANRHLGWLREPLSKPRTDWNTCEIVCKEDRITVTMNGVLVNEGWGAEVVAGHICLRNQNSAVEFRNIRLVNDL